MTSPDDYESVLCEAARELAEASTAEDLRRAWRKHFGALGHRVLGRLLVGRSADELLARRAERGERA